MISNVSIVTIFCAKDGRIIRVNKEETFNCKNAVLQRWFGVFAAQPNGYFQKTERKRFRNLYGSVCKADYPFFRILQKPLIITVAAGIRFILEKNHKFYTFAVIESSSMRTRFFIASALLLMLAILPSCTKGSIVDIDKAESTLVVTLPDGSDVSVENALFSFMTTGSYAVFGRVTDKDQSLFLFWSLVFGKDSMMVGKEMDFQRVMFGILVSSDGRDYTDTFTGRIYLVGKADTGIVIQMKDVRFTIGKGTYRFNGQLVCRQETTPPGYI